MTEDSPCPIVLHSFIPVKESKGKLFTSQKQLEKKAAVSNYLDYARKCTTLAFVHFHTMHLLLGTSVFDN